MIENSKVRIRATLGARQKFSPLYGGNRNSRQWSGENQISHQFCAHVSVCFSMSYREGKQSLPKFGKNLNSHHKNSRKTTGNIFFSPKFGHYSYYSVFSV